MTAYYVSNSGSDSNNGLSEVNAFLTPGYASSIAQTPGDVIYIKADGDYNLSNTTYNTSGGPMEVAIEVSVEGYGTTVGDEVKATINNNSLSPSLGLMNHLGGQNFGVPYFIKNIILNAKSDGTNAALTCLYSQGFDNMAVYYNCEFNDSALSLAYRNDSFGVTALKCIFRKKDTNGVGRIHHCFMEESQVTSCDEVSNSISKNAGVLSTNPSAATSNYTVNGPIINCIAYNDTGYFLTNTRPFGINSRFGNGGSVHGCIAWGGGQFSHTYIAPKSLTLSMGLAYGNFLDPLDTGGAVGGPYTLSEPYQLNTFEIFEDPFVDAPNNDFRLKRSGSGLLLRNYFIERNLP